MSDEFQRLSFENMQPCPLQEVFEKGGASATILRRDGIRRMTFSWHSEGEYFNMTIAEPISTFKQCSRNAARLKLLMDFDMSLSKVAVIREKIVLGPLKQDPILYETGESVLAPMSDLKNNLFAEQADVLTACSEYNGRLDYIKLICGGKTFRVQNKAGDILQIPDEISNVRFQIVLLFLLQHDLNLDENEQDCENLEKVLEEQYDEESYFRWADDSFQPCDEECCEREDDERSCSVNEHEEEDEKCENDCDRECEPQLCECVCKIEEKDCEKNNNSCVICLDAKRNTVFTVCGHICCCLPCSENVTRCPVCQANSKVIKIFNV